VPYGSYSYNTFVEALETVETEQNAAGEEVQLGQQRPCDMLKKYCGVLLNYFSLLYLLIVIFFFRVLILRIRLV